MCSAARPSANCDERRYYQSSNTGGIRRRPGAHIKMRVLRGDVEATIPTVEVLITGTTTLAIKAEANLPDQAYPQWVVSEVATAGALLPMVDVSVYGGAAIVLMRETNCHECWNSRSHR